MRHVASVLSICLFVSFAIGAAAAADELTKMAQEHLTQLGYETGTTDGEMNVTTAVAISKFQAQNDLEVTGEVTPQLVGILSARLDEQENPSPAGTAGTMAAASAHDAAAPAAAPEAAAPEVDPETLRQAQEACLKEKIAEAEAKRKKRRGFGSLMSAVTRTAGQLGNREVSAAANDVYQANATAADLSQAAEDLGVTESDIEQCQNPL